MNENFDHAFDLVIGEEGGYQNGYNDRGNWTSGRVGVGRRLGTKYGVTAMNYPQYDIPNLTLDQAKAIYEEDYWTPCACDELPDGVDYMVFDIAINHGKGDAIRFAQEAVGTLVDGIVGPKTIAAIREANPLKVLGSVQRIRQYDYTNLGTWDHYGKGWSRRNANVTEEALLMLAEAVTREAPLDQSNEEPAAEVANDNTILGGLFRRVS